MKNEVMTTNYEVAKIEDATLTNLTAEMAGLDGVDFDIIKVPTGGGIAFEVPTDNPDEPESAAAIEGVIVYRHPVNAYWKEDFTGGSDTPDCSSYDGQTGVVAETGEMRACATCPYNQFGSKGAGKACRNGHRLYILRSGEMLPLILSVPPTSIKNLSNYVVKRVIMENQALEGVVTKITLKKDKSSGGITYSKLAFANVGTLSDEDRASARKIGEMVKGLSHKVEIRGFEEVNDGTTFED